MTLIQDASSIVGVRIEPGYWKKSVERLDVQGAFTRKNMMDLIIMLCEHVEKLEQLYGTTNRTKPETKSDIQSIA